ncbi:hypothetical protein [Acidicapsa ligni]|uniref:hypothetical protein n=1 Tax=Acidicapsa ligni TaxID=542300 RepID=UPI0021DF6404|nr:hypothetical protein [Acidicapsa ligni]
MTIRKTIRKPVRKLLTLSTLACVAITTFAFQQNDVVQRVDAAVHARIDALTGYTVQEHYTLYRNGDPNPSTEVTVQVSEQHSGKTYTTISKSGSAFFRAAVIDKVLASETEMSKPAKLEGVLLTSANYNMQPEPGKVSLNNRNCVIVDLQARRKDSHLLNGKIWVDADNASIVHAEGKPAASASIFSGDITISRDYTTIDGLAMATHAEAHSHSFLLGDSVLKIDYIGYQIQRSSPAPLAKQ